MKYRFAVAACMTSLLSLAAPAVAQEEEQKSEPVEIIGFNFDGGTIGDYVKTILEAAKGANIVLTDKRACDIMLPPIHLQAVSVETAAKVIDGDYPIDEEHKYNVSVYRMGSASPNEKPVFRIELSINYEPKLYARVWNVIDLLGDSLKSEDLLTAIEQAMELLNEDDSEVNVRFHEPSGVLIAKGTLSQVTAIDTLISELRGHMTLSAVFSGLAGTPEGQANPQDTLARILEKIESLEKKVEEIDHRVRGVSRD